MLLWAAIRRDPVSFLSFPFLSHVQVLSCEIQLVCLLKRLNCCSSSNFYFLVIFYQLMFVLSVLFLLAESVFLRSFLCRLLVDVLMGQHYFKCWQVLFLFFPLHVQFKSSLEYKVLNIFRSILLLWSICWSSSPVHFKNSPEYLTKMIRFLLCSLVASNFLVLLRYSFFNFFLSSVWWRLLAIFPGICKFHFLIAFRYFLDLVVLLIPSFVVFCLSILSG